MKELLKEYRKVRKIRDEILTCDNYGRIKRLILSYPHVQRVSFRSSSNDIRYAEVEYYSGYIFREYGADAFKTLGIQAYFDFLKRL